jgi:hypothetical protein
MVEEFGIDKVSEGVKAAYNNNNGENRFEVVHCIQKNNDIVHGRADASGMQFESVYYELNCSPEKFLRKSGYETIPFVAPRWTVVGVDTYGSCPGMDALADVKMLQKMEEKKLKALDKMVDPPMNAPVSMKGKGGTVISGGINYVDAGAGGQSFTPAYQINPDFQKISIEIERVETRIKRFFYNDLFLSVLQQDKSMTATEVAERHQEKLVVLGPILERLQSELLGQIIDRIFHIMLRLNILPPVPEEISGMELKVDYISMLAQAQKSVGSTAITQLANFVGAVAQVSPESIDKFDGDEAIDQYADMIGVSPKVIRSDDVVAQVRQQKAQAQAQAQSMAALQANAQTGKLLSETSLEGDSALSRMAASAGMKPPSPK